MSKPYYLLEGATANVTGDAKSTPGGVFQLVVEGDLGGGNITLDTSLDGTNWQDVYATDGTELVVDASNNYVSTIRLQSALNIRAVLAGATAPDVTVALV